MFPLQWCWGITRAELQKIYRLYPEFNIHGRIITGEYYCRGEERNIANKRQAPDDKYEQLMAKDANLIRMVSHIHMASYFDLSERFRRDMIKNYQAMKRLGIKRKRSRGG